MEQDLLTKYLVEARDILKSPILGVPEPLLPTEDQIRPESRYAADMDMESVTESEDDMFGQIDFVKPEQV